MDSPLKIDPASLDSSVDISKDEIARATVNAPEHLSAPVMSPATSISPIIVVENTDSR